MRPQCFPQGQSIHIGDLGSYQQGRPWRGTRAPIPHPAATSHTQDSKWGRWGNCKVRKLSLLPLLDAFVGAAHRKC